MAKQEDGDFRDVPDPPPLESGDDVALPPNPEPVEGKDAEFSPAPDIKPGDSPSAPDNYTATAGSMDRVAEHKTDAPNMPDAPPVDSSSQDVGVPTATDAPQHDYSVPPVPSFRDDVPRYDGPDAFSGHPQDAPQQDNPLGEAVARLEAVLTRFADKIDAEDGAGESSAEGTQGGSAGSVSELRESIASLVEVLGGKKDGGGGVEAPSTGESTGGGGDDVADQLTKLNATLEQVRDLLVSFISEVLF